MVRVGPDFGDNNDHNLATQISGQCKDEEDDEAKFWHPGTYLQLCSFSGPFVLKQVLWNILIVIMTLFTV